MVSVPFGVGMVRLKRPPLYSSQNAARRRVRSDPSTPICQSDCPRKNRSSPIAARWSGVSVSGGSGTSMAKDRDQMPAQVATVADRLAVPPESALARRASIYMVETAATLERVSRLLQGHLISAPRWQAMPPRQSRRTTP